MLKDMVVVAEVASKEIQPADTQPAPAAEPEPAPKPQPTPKLEPTPEQKPPPEQKSAVDAIPVKLVSNAPGFSWL